MIATAQLRGSPPESKVLLRSAAAAFIIEFAILVAVGVSQHWIAHPQKTTGLDTDKFIEAQVFQPPPEAHLMEEKKIAIPSPHPEATLSKVPNQGKKSKSEENKVQEENQTDSGTSLAPTHGPVAVFSPPPTIPSYLREKELNASVVIDFFVTAQGTVTPRLVGSSGNEELDAIALGAVKKWQFRSAEQDHKPVDSKVRLRIVFEVK